MVWFRKVPVIAGWLLLPLAVISVYSCAIQTPNKASSATRPNDFSMPRVTIFDTSQDHPWNRLHAALFVRTAPDGQHFGADEVDPLLWANTTFLLQGDSYTNGISEMDGFLANNSARLIQDPVKRAVLQSELWAIFDWAAAPGQRRDYDAAIGALQSRLARIITQLSLSEEQIQRLPDNYAQAVDSHRWPDRFDPRAPDKPFLPADLLQRNGPWVLINPAARLATPVHFQFVSGRSVFSVFIRLPGGRQATLDYLNRINTFAEPLVIQSGQSPPFHFPLESFQFQLNPNFPQFPEGTQLALVRQMMLIDRNGALIPSHIVQSIQIRVERRIAGSPAAANEEPPQAFCEFLLRKSELFNGHSGGLVAVESGDKAFLQLMAMPFDPLESTLPRPPQPYRDQRRPALDCTACHRDGGVFSFQTLQQAAFARMGSPQLQESDIGYVREITAGQKRMQYDWGLLTGLTRGRE
jgi:hypothetical protein